MPDRKAQLARCYNAIAELTDVIHEMEHDGSADATYMELLEKLRVQTYITRGRYLVLRTWFYEQAKGTFNTFIMPDGHTFRTFHPD